MITPPPLIDVKPGDPITSQNWNNVNQAIRILYDALNKSLGTLAVTVKNKADGNPVRAAIVTATPTGDSGRPLRVALFAGAGANVYQMQQLLPGAYDVVIEADGYNSETRPITMDPNGSDQPLTIELTATQLLFPMPNLFGLALNEAVDKVVTQGGFQVGRIIDSHGQEIPPGAITEDAKLAAVLGQVPEPGTPIPKNTPVQIHISAKAEFAERVKVPDLRGLTLEEAKAKLEASRLVVGETGNLGAKMIIPL